MPLVLVHLENLQAKSVLAFMGAMEGVHAKVIVTFSQH